MLRLTKRQRAILVETIPRLANLAVAGLIVSQFVGARRLSFTVAIAGVITWAALIVVTLVLVRNKDAQ